MSRHRKAAGKSLLAGLLAMSFAGLAGAGAQPSADGHATHEHANHEPATLPSIAADDPHAQHKQQAAAGGSKLASVRLPEGLVLTNQKGEQVDLRRDVIGDRVAVVNFVYTNCTTVCPVTSTIFSMLQKNLDRRLGKEVVLVTLTVDPARDTPHRLRSFAKNFAPGEAWSWLTGDNGTVESALRAFGAYAANFEDHPAMVLVGDAANSTWYRLYGFPAPEAIESKIDELLNDRTS
ncbi:MAG: SCO family protein [Gammaproteobacteria bacterium]|nr:SCO family protein [Gammaproteobacteria bacterium]MDH3536448.1 SCO family protein [Gammaproteobacteria bacterium]